MVKFFLPVLLFVTTVMGDVYQFSELRYTDAIGRYVQLDGEIDFQKDTLEIKYPKIAVDLLYDEDGIVYHKNGKEIELESSQASHMEYYFDILKMLHEGDEDELKSQFKMTKSGALTLLKPTGSVKYYIDKIELTKENKKLKYVKIYLKNSDYITINIHDEIH